MQSVFIVLGNQLFPPTLLRKKKPEHIFMAEDYGLCTHFKYHKHKIIMFLSAMRHYRDEVKSIADVTYYDVRSKLFKKSYEDKLLSFLTSNKKVRKIEFFEIEDKFFEKRILAFAKKNKVETVIHPSPMFMQSREGFRDYLDSQKKPFMKTFYERQRKEFKVLLDPKGKPTGGKWSYDAENRKKLPKDLEPPEALISKPDAETKKVMSFVEKTFPKHPGQAENFWIPVTRKETLKWLKAFANERLPRFGDYQDSITSRSEFLYHSVLSPMVNMGLILPNEMIDAVEKKYKSSPKKIPLNATEGFVRQVLGWREFVRGIYQNYSEEQWKTNFWKNKRKMKPCWYDGSTGIPLLDDCIQKAQKYSYNHHIERLMILSNFMLLCELHPHEVYKWFMEMYADSSDWVMGPNVFGMGQFSDGGVFATKPYICGSNYYKKMSDYPTKDWADIADGLYWRFVDKHIDFYKSNPRMSMMVGSLNKMDKSRKKRIFKSADDFIKKVTKT